MSIHYIVESWTAIAGNYYYYYTLHAQTLCQEGNNKSKGQKRKRGGQVGGPTVQT